MTNKYTLCYLPAAVDDPVSIFDWIVNDSPANCGTFQITVAAEKKPIGF